MRVPHHDRALFHVAVHLDHVHAADALRAAGFRAFAAALFTGFAAFFTGFAAFFAGFAAFLAAGFTAFFAGAFSVFVFALDAAIVTFPA